MTQDEQKHAAARAALRYVVDDAYIGVGSGSTANFFIDELATIKSTGRELSHEGFYQKLLGLGMPLGPTLKSIERLWATDGGALLRGVLPDASTADASSFAVHPVLVDTVL